MERGRRVPVDDPVIRHTRMIQELALFGDVQIDPPGLAVLAFLEGHGSTAHG